MSSGTTRAISINYHFLRSSRAGRFELRSHEQPHRFEQQLASLGEQLAFVRCRDLLDPDRDSSEPCVAVTFDDGARDVFEYALPLLLERGATATVFICSKPYLEGKLLQIQKVEYLVSKCGLEGFRQAFYDALERQFPGEIEREPLDFAAGYQFYRYDDAEIRRFKLDLNYQLPYANVEPVLDALFAQVFGPSAEADAVRETYLSRDELKRLVDAGVELGAHTHAHRVLPRLGLAEQKYEIETNLALLKEITGSARPCLAYPFGFHDEQTRKAAEELGFVAGFACGRRAITEDDLRERWSIPRYDVNDCFDRSTNEPIDAVFAGLSD